MFCHHSVRKLDHYRLDIILKRLYPVFHTLSCTDTSVTFSLAQPWTTNIRSEDEGGHLQVESVKSWTRSLISLTK